MIPDEHLETIDIIPDTRVVDVLAEEHNYLSALEDLIDNHIQATLHNPEGQRLIQLSMTLLPGTERDFEFEIRDNGCGMTFDELRLFGKLGVSGNSAKAREEANPRDSISFPEDYEDIFFCSGKFSRYGVGGKSSTFNIGSKITVISKTKDDPLVGELVIDHRTLENNTWHAKGGQRKAEEDEEASFTIVRVSNLRQGFIDIWSDDVIATRLSETYYWYLAKPPILPNCDDIVLNKLVKIDITVAGKSLANQCNFIQSVLTTGKRRLDFRMEVNGQASGIVRMIFFYFPYETHHDTKPLGNSPSASPLLCFWQGRLIRDVKLNIKNPKMLPFMDKAAAKAENIPERVFDRVLGFVFFSSAFQPNNTKTGFLHNHEPFHSFFTSKKEIKGIKGTYREWIRQCHNELDDEIKWLGTAAVQKDDAGARTFYSGVDLLIGSKNNKSSVIWQEDHVKVNIRELGARFATILKLFHEGEPHGKVADFGSAEVKVFGEEATRLVPLTAITSKISPKQWEKFERDEKNKFPSAIKFAAPPPTSTAVHKPTVFTIELTNNEGTQPAGMDTVEIVADYHPQDLPTAFRPLTLHHRDGAKISFEAIFPSLGTFIVCFRGKSHSSNINQKKIPVNVHADVATNIVMDPQRIAVQLGVPFPEIRLVLKDRYGNNVPVDASHVLEFSFQAAGLDSSYKAEIDSLDISCIVISNLTFTGQLTVAEHNACWRIGDKIKSSAFKVVLRMGPPCSMALTSDTLSKLMKPLANRTPFPSLSLDISDAWGNKFQRNQPESYRLLIESTFAEPLERNAHYSQGAVQFAPGKDAVIKSSYFSDFPKFAANAEIGWVGEKLVPTGLREKEHADATSSYYVGFTKGTQTILVGDMVAYIKTDTPAFGIIQSVYEKDTEKRAKLFVLRRNGAEVVHKGDFITIHLSMITQLCHLTTPSRYEYYRRVRRLRDLPHVFYLRSELNTGSSSAGGDDNIAVSVMDYNGCPVLKCRVGTQMNLSKLFKTFTKTRMKPSCGVFTFKGIPLDPEKKASDYGIVENDVIYHTTHHALISDAADCMDIWLIRSKEAEESRVLHLSCRVQIDAGSFPCHLHVYRVDAADEDIDTVRAEAGQPINNLMCLVSDEAHNPLPSVTARLSCSWLKDPIEVGSNPFRVPDIVLMNGNPSATISLLPLQPPAAAITKSIRFDVVAAEARSMKVAFTADDTTQQPSSVPSVAAIVQCSVGFGLHLQFYDQYSNLTRPVAFQDLAITAAHENTTDVVAVEVYNTWNFKIFGDKISIYDLKLTGSPGIIRVMVKGDSSILPSASILVELQPGPCHRVMVSAEERSIEVVNGSTLPKVYARVVDACNPPHVVMDSSLEVNVRAASTQIACSGQYCAPLHEGAAVFDKITIKGSEGLHQLRFGVSNRRGIQAGELVVAVKNRADAVALKIVDFPRTVVANEKIPRITAQAVAQNGCAVEIDGRQCEARLVTERNTMVAHAIGLSQGAIVLLEFSQAAPIAAQRLYLSVTRNNLASLREEVVVVHGDAAALGVQCDDDTVENEETLHELPDTITITVTDAHRNPCLNCTHEVCLTLETDVSKPKIRGNFKDIFTSAHIQQGEVITAMTRPLVEGCCVIDCSELSHEVPDTVKISVGPLSQVIFIESSRKTRREDEQRLRERLGVVKKELEDKMQQLAEVNRQIGQWTMQQQNRMREKENIESQMAQLSAVVIPREEAAILRRQKDHELARTAHPRVSTAKDKIRMLQEASIDHVLGLVISLGAVDAVPLFLGSSNSEQIGTTVAQRISSFIGEKLNYVVIDGPSMAAEAAAQQQVLQVLKHSANQQVGFVMLHHWTEMNVTCPHPSSPNSSQQPLMIPAVPAQYPGFCGFLVNMIILPESAVSLRRRLWWPLLRDTALFKTWEQAQHYMNSSPAHPRAAISLDGYSNVQGVEVFGMEIGPNLNVMGGSECHYRHGYQELLLKLQHSQQHERQIGELETKLGELNALEYIDTTPLLTEQHALQQAISELEEQKRDITDEMSVSNSHNRRNNKRSKT